MKEISKPWNWSKNTQDIWNTPSEESYYLLNRWKNKNYKNFLDLGCGLGRHSLLFATNDFQVNSYDLSNTAVNELISKATSLELHNIVCTTGDMNKLPYPDNSFDCLLAYHVISHTDSQGIKDIIKEINRVLKRNGEFYLTLCSKNSWSFQESGYPKHDENTIIKIEDGPENGIPHFYSDENTITSLFSNFKLINIRHTKDIVFNETALKNSWHYFILGQKE
jgi:ubiquinone/menaquinone biosynthesis C-methylase UbiE